MLRLTLAPAAALADPVVRLALDCGSNARTAPANPKLHDRLRASMKKARRIWVRVDDGLDEG